MEDWREKLAKSRGLHYEEPTQKETDWSKEARKYTKKSNTYRKKSGGRKDKVPRQKEYTFQEVKMTAFATAPYNFISLTNTVVPSPLQGDGAWPHYTDKEVKEAFAQYLLAEPTYTGMITLHITNETPLFIGAGKDQEQPFSPNGRPVIPGSTLRGMIRSLFNIVTAGTMRPAEDFTNRHLYYRCIMAPKGMPQLKELHVEYGNRMMTEKMLPDKKTGELRLTDVKTTQPGFLVRLKGSPAYYIVPCSQQNRDPYEYPRHSRESCVGWDDNNKGAYIYTGNQANKPKIRFLSEPQWDTMIPVPSQVIEEYRSDKNRRGVDLLNGREDVKKDGAASAFAGRDDVDRIAPCFFITENDVVTSFGHGRSYRIPYRHTVGDRIPEALQNPDIIDFADAVFGRKEYWAGRVSVEDAQLEGAPQYEQADFIKPQLGANPTSYQLYLKQSAYPPAHWDSPRATTIRGYKAYWHHAVSKWQAETKNERNENVTKRIQPLKKGQTFTAKIHFRELRAVELGALLDVFQLGTEKQDIVYKIGMGKSVGLGSIRIRAALHLDTASQYKTLFSDTGWYTGQEAADPAAFVDAFAAYMKQHLGEAGDSYTQSMQDLATMLDWNTTTLPHWEDRIAAMSGDVQSGTVDERYISKALLKEVKDVVKK